MTDTSDIEIVFDNPYTTEEMLRFLAAWSVGLNRQRFDSILEAVDHTESEDPTE